MFYIFKVILYVSTEVCPTVIFKLLNELLEC